MPKYYLLKTFNDNGNVYYPNITPYNDTELPAAVFKIPGMTMLVTPTTKMVRNSSPQNKEKIEDFTVDPASPIEKRKIEAAHEEVIVGDITNINTCTKEELLRLKGVDEKLADKIIHLRAKKLFLTFDSLKMRTPMPLGHSWDRIRDFIIFDSNLENVPSIDA